MLKGIATWVAADIKADLPLQGCAQKHPTFFDLRLIATQISAGLGEAGSAFAHAGIAAPRTTRG